VAVNHVSACVVHRALEASVRSAGTLGNGEINGVAFDVCELL
jgi:hypothetical protein